MERDRVVDPGLDTLAGEPGAKRIPRRRLDHEQVIHMATVGLRVW